MCAVANKLTLIWKGLVDTRHFSIPAEAERVAVRNDSPFQVEQYSIDVPLETGSDVDTAVRRGAEVAYREITSHISQDDKLVYGLKQPHVQADGTKVILRCLFFSFRLLQSGGIPAI